MTDTEKEISKLNTLYGELKTRMEAVENYNTIQNGSISRIEKKADKMDAKFDDKTDKINSNITGIYKILLGTAASAVLSFLGTIITLLVILSQKGN